jgi:hypothetical protein
MASPRAKLKEKVVYRGGWEMSYRCAVSSATVDVLKDLGWEVVSDKAVQRLVFVQVTVYEKWEPGYQLRLHAQQPDMNVSVDYVLGAHDLAQVMLPLFKGKSSRPVENALAASSFLPPDENGNSIVNRSLRKWAAQGWAPRRGYLIDWLLQRLRILEDYTGEVKLQLEPTEEQSLEWIERETKRRFDALMGNKDLLLRNAKATEIQSIMRGHLARKKVQEIHDHFDHQIKDEKARMIQNVWKNHTGRRQLHRLYLGFTAQMQEQSVIMIQSQIRGSLARLHFKHTKDQQAKEEDAARMLQAAWRGFKARQEYDRLKKERDEMLRNKAAVILQSWFRERKCRHKYLELKAEMRRQLEEQYAIILQCNWRCYKARCMVQALREAKELERQHKAATKIQALHRGNEDRKIIEKKYRQVALEYRLQKAAIMCQRIIRGHIARKVLFQDVFTKHQSMVRNISAKRIQAHLRGSLARWHFNHAKIEERKRIDAAIRLQSNWRGYLGKNRALVFKRIKERADNLAKMLKERAVRRAALEYETRKLIEREKERVRREKLLMEKHSAVTMVQSAWRGRMARAEFRKVREEYNKKIDHESAQCVQFAWRNRMARNKLHKLEQWYNSKIETESAIIVQTHVRGTLARIQFKVKKDDRDKNAAIMIQCAYRRRHARQHVAELKKERDEKLRIQRVIIVQSQWRRQVAKSRVNGLRKERDDKLREQAAIMLQCAWRRKLAYKKYHALRHERMEQIRIEEEKQMEEGQRAAAEAARIAEELRLKEEEENRETDEQREAREKREEEEREKRRQEVIDAKKAHKEAVQARKREVDGRVRRERAKINSITKQAEEEEKKKAEDEQLARDREERRQKRKERDRRREEARKNKKENLYPNAPHLNLNDSQRSFSAPTEEVYRGVWEMPCDLPDDTWVEVSVRVFERFGPYRLRFEGRPKIIWSNKKDYNNLHSAKYTIHEEEMSKVLLPAFHKDNQAQKKKMTKSLTSTAGGKKSDEMAMQMWAKTGKAPRRMQFIHFALKRMRVGIRKKNKAVKFVLQKKSSESYEVPAEGHGSSA